MRQQEAGRLPDSVGLARSRVRFVFMRPLRILRNEPINFTLRYAIAGLRSAEENATQLAFTQPPAYRVRPHSETLGHVWQTAGTGRIDAPKCGPGMPIIVESSLDTDTGIVGTSVRRHRSRSVLSATPPSISMPDNVAS
jgi:hypothetical protein